jgi:hypothetical protein
VIWSSYNRDASLATICACRAVRRSQTTSPCEKRKKNIKKQFHEEEFPDKCFALPNEHLRSMRSRSDLMRYKVGTPVGVGTYNKAQVLPPASVYLHVVRRAICTNQNVFSLREKRGDK